jgi:hypothetical protein
MLEMKKLYMSIERLEKAERGMKAKRKTTAGAEGLHKDKIILINDS